MPEVIDLTNDDEEWTPAAQTVVDVENNAAVTHVKVKPEAKPKKEAIPAQALMAGTEDRKAKATTENSEIWRKIVREMEKLIARALYYKDKAFTRRHCRAHLKELFGASEVDSREHDFLEQFDESLKRIRVLSKHDLLLLATQRTSDSNSATIAGAKFWKLLSFVYNISVTGNKVCPSTSLSIRVPHLSNTYLQFPPIPPKRGGSEAEKVHRAFLSNEVIHSSGENTQLVIPKYGGGSEADEALRSEQCESEDDDDADDDHSNHIYSGFEAMMAGLQSFIPSSYRTSRRRRKRRDKNASQEMGEMAEDSQKHGEHNARADYLDDDVGLSHTDGQEQTFTAYLPPTCNHQILKIHPDQLVETASLASVPEPIVVNKLRLPSRTLLEGLLTNAQLEVCLRAIAQHELRLPNGQRCGFFMGDGAGVGKGRQQAGIIFHNFLHGRNKAVWISISPDLIEDARRDIQDIGAGRFVSCHDLKDYRITQDLRAVSKLQSGILFCTYSLLVSGSGSHSRLEQLIEWCSPDFEGILTLDECHRAKNLSKAGASKAALAVRELQDRLPLARVVYVSATGVTEPEHLACLSRLGLWGADTAFANSSKFIDDIKKGGVGAMELCAMHMKASGQYLARSLSFTGASFDVVREDLSPDFIRMYDAAAMLWLKIVKMLYHETAGTDGRSAKAQLWGVHQRFWAQICMGAKVELTVRTAKGALLEGKCVVIGLQNTGESVAGEDELSEEPCSTADGVLRAFLTRNCEILPYPKRQELLEDLKRIKLPNNPLDEIIHQLGGPTKVAEMTGRKCRYVFREGIWQYVPRVKERGTSDALNIAERKKFQTGQKLVAIISEAASTGISLQADRRAINQRRRVHITFQLPWSAEKAVQQMGRSHRSNQTSAPEFKLVLSPLGGEWRFASAVANRLQSLGALTQGDRRAAGASSAMRSFTIDPKYGLKALDQLVSFVFRGDALHHTLPDFITTEYETAERFAAKARTAMSGAGLDPKMTGQGCRLKRFLNRIFGLPSKLQSHVFDLFSYLLEAEIATAKAENKYSEGIVDICGQTNVECELDLYKCPKTGAVAKYYKISTDRGVSWDEAVALQSEQTDSTAGFYQATYQSAANKEIFVLALQKKLLASAASSNHNYYHLVRPNTGYAPMETHRSELLKNYRKVTPERAMSAWQALYKSSEHRCGHTNLMHCAGASCTYQRRLHHYHIVAGLVLPFWKQIEFINANMKVVRASVGEKRIVGLNIFPNAIGRVKEIIQQGISTSARIEERLKNMAQPPFLEPICEPLVMHDCLSTSGVEYLSVRIDPSWNQETVLYVRCFEIPFSNAANAPKQRLKEIAWEQGPQIYLNNELVAVPPGSRKVICPLMIDRSFWEGKGFNNLKIVSMGTRFFIVVQAGKKNSTEKVAEQVEKRAKISASESRALLAELKKQSENDGIEIVSADTISLRCPLGFDRIKCPVRSISCKHVQCFDLRNFLSFAERSNRWTCPVCECILCPEDLRVDALSLEALKLEHLADHFVVNADGTLQKNEEQVGTPPTARKIAIHQDSEVLHLPSCELPMPDLMENGIPEALTELNKCGIWDYCEMAESAFASPPCVSPEGSDTEENVDEKVCSVAHEESIAHEENKSESAAEISPPAETAAVNLKVQEEVQSEQTSSRVGLRRAVRQRGRKVNYAESSDGDGDKAASEDSMSKEGASSDDENCMSDSEQGSASSCSREGRKKGVSPRRSRPLAQRSKVKRCKTGGQGGAES